MILQAAAAVTTASLHNTTFAFSNVVGPQEDIILYGHPLSYISPTVSGFPQVSKKKKRNYFILFLLVIILTNCPLIIEYLVACYSI